MLCNVLNMALYNNITMLLFQPMPRDIITMRSGSGSVILIVPGVLLRFCILVYRVNAAYDSVIAGKQQRSNRLYIPK